LNSSSFTPSSTQVGEQSGDAMVVVEDVVVVDVDVVLVVVVVSISAITQEHAELIEVVAALQWETKVGKPVVAVEVAVV
jgi:alkyl hydroperoxide reductase subunit AhpC